MLVTPRIKCIVLRGCFWRLPEPSQRNDTPWNHATFELTCIPTGTGLQVQGETTGMLSEPQTQSVPPPFESFTCGEEFTADTLDRRPLDQISCLKATCYEWNTLAYPTICQLQNHMRLAPMSTTMQWVLFCDRHNSIMHRIVVRIMQISLLRIENLR